MALNTLYLWNQLYFGWMNRRADKNTQEATAWKQADKNITAWAKLDNEANALSLLFDDIASSQWSKALTSSRMDSLRKLGKESIFFARFDHFARNYTAKTANTCWRILYIRIPRMLFSQRELTVFSPYSGLCIHRARLHRFLKKLLPKIWLSTPPMNSIRHKIH